MLRKAEKSSLSLPENGDGPFRTRFLFYLANENPISYTFFLSRIRFPLKTGKQSIETYHFFRQKQAYNAKNWS